MKDKTTYAIGLFAIVALLALLGQAGGGPQLQSAVALGLVGVNIALNVAIWRFLPPRKMTLLLFSGGRLLAALLLCAATVVTVMATGLAIGEIRINGSSLFGGENGFALFGTLQGSTLCAGISAIAYLIGQLFLQFRKSVAQPATGIK